jgi:hypothetical protein
VRRLAVILGTAAAALAAAAPAPAAAPQVEQMVVFRSGDAHVSAPGTKRLRVRVGSRRCSVAAATPLAALVRSKAGPLGLRDYGRCGRRPSAAGGLYVRSIANDRARGRGGWVYKVGNRQGTAGAADSSGPFGRGRLREGQRVTWFYCVLDDDGGCQRTLGTRSSAGPGGEVTVTVRSYDDEGRARPAAGATVRAGEASATAGSDGVAHLTLAPGTHTLHAEQGGRIRSFPEEILVP